MKSKAIAAIPQKVLREIKKFGEDLSLARRKRKLTMRDMAARTSISMATYQRIEKGDPTVTFGLYAFVLFSLGLGERIGELVDVSVDDIGLVLDQARVPKRVRRSNKEGSL
jgi:transcriptional regulator with XRE-family HTH domain